MSVEYENRVSMSYEEMLKHIGSDVHDVKILDPDAMQDAYEDIRDLKSMPDNYARVMTTLADKKYTDDYHDVFNQYIFDASLTDTYRIKGGFDDGKCICGKDCGRKNIFKNTIIYSEPE